MNIGEEICGEYLKHICECDFVTYNVINTDKQGEMDVLGINIKQNRIYVCEVATHTNGLHYSKLDKQEKKRVRDDYNRFKSKFTKNFHYIKKHFKTDMHVTFMLWAPIVKKTSKDLSYNVEVELDRLCRDFEIEFSSKIELVINEAYAEKLKKMREYASSVSREFTSNTMRLFQIESKLEAHLSKRRD